jgi:CRP/FNR family cyclic AMP-dependent transcriptional regulator
VNDLWFIPPSDFLARMEPQERERLLEAANRQTFARNDFVFQAGSPGANIYLLLEGRIKIFQLSALGKEIIQWFCFPGEVFGLAEAPRGGRRGVYAQACADTVVCTVSKNDFNAFLNASPSTAMLVIDLLSCRLRVLGDMLLNLTADDVTSRVIKLLTRLCARYGRRVDNDIRLDIHLTHQEMADMIGTSRQTVTTVLSQLRRKGVVRVEDHCIHIQEPEALGDLADAFFPDTEDLTRPPNRAVAPTAMAAALKR